MEQQAIAGLKRQWKGIQALSEVLDSLRIEERSGVDLGNLAVKELERYAALAEKSKEEMRTIKDEHAAAVERLEDSVRAQKDEIRELQHQHALEVHKLQTEVTEMKHKHEVTLHQVQAHQSAAEGLQQRLAEQQQHYQRGHAQMQGELQALAAKCEALSRERDSAQQRCAQMEHQMLHFQQQQQQQQQHHGSQPVGRNAQGHNLSGANGTGGQVLQQQQHTAHDESGRMEILMLLPPKMWNVEQVAEWVTLQSVDSGLRQYAAVFAQNQIDGDLLLEMDGGDLSEMNITNSKHRKALQAAIGNLKDGGSGMVAGTGADNKVGNGDRADLHETNVAQPASNARRAAQAGRKQKSKNDSASKKKKKR